LISSVTLLLAFPIVFLISLLFEGMDRKVHARMQNRIGPPIIQPFYDYIKLFNKERIIPETATSITFVSASIVAFACAIFAATIPLVNLIIGASISGDLILIIHLLAMYPIMAMIGGAASGNPYGSVGFSRKMTMVIAYEVPLLISIITLSLKTDLSFAIWNTVTFQTEAKMLLAFTDFSVMLAAIAFLLCIPVAAGVVPFDIAEAKTEIAHGTLIEYGGIYLALMKLAKAISIFALTFIAAILFFYVPTLFQNYIPLGLGGSLLLSLITAFIFMLLTITVPRTIFARLRICQAFKFCLIIPLTISLLSLALALIGL
jgi:NADH-quinone oxidoreductase subunit H